MFQSAPEFTLGGNPKPVPAPGAADPFQSAPEFTLGGNIDLARCGVVAG